MNFNQVSNKDQAIDEAIAWQVWQADQDLSWGELIEWQAHFESLAEKFNLTEEFRENGIL